MFSTATQADDLADEADLHFKIAAERYAAKDFRGALEHFLVSNRLVPNRNVVFNIARTYEQLQEFPDAFRYYTQLLELSPDQATKARADESLGRIRPNVGVLSVTTNPPGATVFIDRQDLGPRGVTPRTLGFAAGKYKVIVELAGYEPATSQEIEIKTGEERAVALELKRIVGTLRVQGDAGAAVRVDDPNAAPAGNVPIDLVLAPGRHRLYISREGFRSAEQDVDLVAKSVTSTTVVLSPTTGALVVNADEPDALVEVDGKPMGFTPAVLTVQSGTRKVRVSRKGFRSVEATVAIRTNEQTRIDLELRQDEQVEAASRQAESVEVAPSSVTIIPAQELRAMGYPTVFEALRGVRGVYVTDDALYPTAGIRGFSSLGDYGNRVLTLVNGTAQNENWAGASYMSYDSRVDLEDVERIEVVRGPGSVLYGTGAFSGVVNVVTRRAPAKLGGSAGISASENGMFRGRVAFDLPFGRDSGMWTSVSGGHSTGRDYYLPQTITPPSFDPATGVGAAGFDGNSRGADALDAGTVTGGLWVKSFSAQWLVNFRTKTLPTGIFGTTLGNPGTKFTDGRGFVELKFEPEVNRYLALMTRGVLNHYWFNGAFTFNPPPIDESTAQERFRGVWGVLEQRVVLTPIPELRFTLGGEGQLHFKVAQQGLETDCIGEGDTKTCDSYSYLGEDTTFSEDSFDEHPFQIGAGYALIDVIPSEKFRLSAGARIDYYSSFGSSGPSPRVAVIFRPYEDGIVKLMGGRAFRAPSVFEQFYAIGGISIPNEDLKPETIWSGEVEWTHRLSTTVTALGSGYANYLDNLVSLRGSGDEIDPSQYTNNGAPVLTLGTEFELKREWRGGWMASAAYSYQRSKYQEDGTKTLRNVPNSPQHMGSFRGAVPLSGKLATIGTRLTIESGRFDRHDTVADVVAQGKTDPSAVWDIVLSGEVERYQMRYNVGVYNAVDYRYDVPVSSDQPIDTVPQSGRTFLATANVAF